jgi:hypothetical protein
VPVSRLQNLIMISLVSEPWQIVGCLRAMVLDAMSGMITHGEMR